VSEALSLPGSLRTSARAPSAFWRAPAS
jgi:hypothetical protein